MKVIRFLDDYLEALLIGIALIAITVIMFIQIILRSTGTAVPWAEEVCRYLFVWSGSLGISYSTKMESHLKLDVLPGLIPALKKPYEIIGDIAMLALCGLLLMPGVEVVQVLVKTGQLSAALRLPMAYVYLGLLVGVILTICRLVEKYVKKLINKLHKQQAETEAT